MENEIIRKHVRHDPVSVPTILKYLRKLKTAVEKIVSKKIPAKFGTVFDGWSVDDTHSIDIFATFSAEVVTGYSKNFLTFFQQTMRPRWGLYNFWHSLTIFSRCL